MQTEYTSECMGISQEFNVKYIILSLILTSCNNYYTKYVFGECFLDQKEAFRDADDTAASYCYSQNKFRFASGDPTMYQCVHTRTGEYKSGWQVREGVHCYENEAERK